MRKTDLASITFVLAGLFAESTANNDLREPQMLEMTTEISTENPCTYNAQEQEVFLNGLYEFIQKSNPCVYELPHVEKEKTLEEKYTTLSI